MSDNKYQINSNRIINLTQADTFKGTEDPSDWRHAIQRIFSSASTGNQKNPVYGSDFSEDGQGKSPTEKWNKSVVKDDVCLLMENQPKFSTSNNYSDLAQNLEKTIGSALSGLDKLTGLLPEPLGSLTSILVNAGDIAAKSTSSIYNFTQTLKNAASGNEGEASSSYAPWYEHIPVWTGADSHIDFSYVFTFAMGQYGLWNAKEEVYKPIMNLVAIASPRNLTKFGITGPSFNLNDAKIEIFKGTVDQVMSAGEKAYKQATVSDNIGGVSIETASSKSADNNEPAGTIEDVETLYSTLINGFTYNIQFGNLLTLNNVIVKNCSWEFANEFDNNGFPIEGSVTMEFSSTLPYALNYWDKKATSIRFGGK